MKYYGAYVPAGLGVQVSLFKEAYLLSNLQYRLSLTNTINAHFFYSIGLAGTIGKRKPVTVAKKVISAPVIDISARDRDGDGMVDTADACPDQAGLAKFQGCPDSDNDGLADRDDSCPTVPGLPKYQGCPIPDRDKDGINDEEDKCIDVAGIKENAGCPPVSNASKTILDSAAKEIYFETGSATLLTKSYQPLNDVVKLLKQDTTLKLAIEGHTDNVGSSSANELLSHARARSVLAYLKDQGISEGRLKAAGFGDKQPIADNTSAAGRAKNRRVELKLDN